MHVLAWIFIGVLVGWGAGRLLEGNGYGPVMGVVLGIGGALGGGFLMHTAGFAGYGGTILTALVAAMGAVLLTMIAGVANGRKIYVRQS
jgi:uncharacterized membrane protein YeaQ/YmgE (transglycosylase-associated protein family)